MITNTYLRTLSHPLLLRKYVEGAILSQLGLTDDFSIGPWPLETGIFINEIVSRLSSTLKEEGQRIGETKKKFSEDKTRFTEEEVGQLWQASREVLQDEISIAWGKDQ